MVRTGDGGITRSEPGEGGAESRVTVHRCANGHAFFVAHESCPLCARPLEESRVPGQAVLLACTIVRVGPGAPFRLGLAEVPCSARTLCLLEGEAEYAPGALVVLERRDGVYRAFPRKRP